MKWLTDVGKTHRKSKIFYSQYIEMTGDGGSSAFGLFHAIYSLGAMMGVCLHFGLIWGNGDLF
jgi:hypothetical protein